MRRRHCSTAARKRAIIGWTMGVNHSTKGTATVNAINNLALAHRQYRPRRLHRHFQLPASATRWARVKPASHPVCRAIANSNREEDRENLPGCGISGRAHSRQARAWRIRTSSKPRWPRKIRALWIIATNPVVSFPNYRRACGRRWGISTFWWCRMDSIRRRPPILLTWFLPAAIWGEKEGTYTNSERRVSKVNVAVDAARRSAIATSTSFSRLPRSLAAAKSSSLAGRARAMRSTNGAACPQGRLCDYSGMTYELLEEHGGDSVALALGSDRERRHRAALCRWRISNRGRARQTRLR